MNVYLVIYVLITGQNFGSNPVGQFERLNGPYENMELCRTAMESQDFPSERLNRYVSENKDWNHKVLVSCIDVAHGESLEQAYHRQVD